MNSQISSIIRYIFKQLWEPGLFLILFIINRISFYNVFQKVLMIGGFGNFFVNLTHLQIQADRFLNIGIIAIALVIPIAAIRLFGYQCRPLMDILAVLLSIRLLIGLIVLNILVFNAIALKDVLMTQVILFTPSVSLMWGWWYWRLDYEARKHGREFMRIKDLNQDGRIDLFDYFYLAVSHTFSIKPPGGWGGSESTYVTPMSKLAKILFMCQGFMMLDLIGVLFSRALSLSLKQ